MNAKQLIQTLLKLQTLEFDETALDEAAEKEAQKTWEERERIGFIKPPPSDDA